MGTILSWVSEVATTSLGNIGGVDVTLGLVVAGAAIASLAFGIIRRARRL
jgi:hypothetical protein